MPTNAKQAKAHMAFRLDERTCQRLREMAELSDLPMTDVVTAAVDALWEGRFQGAGEHVEQANAALALLRRAEEKLGPQFWRRDGGSLSFGQTAEGGPMVLVGRDRYFEDPRGRLLKGRVQGGQAIVVPIEDDGPGDAVAVPVADPAMN